MIVRHFERMGARSVVTEHATPSGLRADVRRRGRTEWFDLQVGRQAELRVVDVRPKLQHLLLLGIDGNGQKNKFLCGHDEREWFVAGVPNDRGVSGVRTALDALKPLEVRQAEIRKRVREKNRVRRRNEASVRQGEWFFVPQPGLGADPRMILRHEPLRRTGGTPHMVDEAIRTGGEPVYVCRLWPNGLPLARYRRLIEERPRLKAESWTVQRRNAAVFVRGNVRHPDHATIRLQNWHLVMMNTEHKAPSMRHVAFID
ncbi:MAG: hypothetical protein AAGI30_06195 [Planctomycetota bacterium]